MSDPNITLEKVWPASPTQYPIAHTWKHGLRSNWLHRYEKLVYERNLQMGIISPYGEHDVVYEYNKQGFRCVEFDAIPASAYRVASVGCSYTEGEALPSEHTMPHLFCKMLENDLNGVPIADLNLGVGGTSNRNIAIRTLAVISSLRPNLIVVMWTHPHRPMYVHDDNQYSDWYVPDEFDRTSTDPKVRLKFDYFEKFQNRFNDLNSLMVDISLVDAACKAASIPCIQSFQYVENADREFIRKRFHHGVFSHRPGDRKARDHAHHGLEHNTWLAQQIHDAYRKL